MKKSIVLASKEFCTGCKACADVCPNNCISFKEERDGFWYPSINHHTCISCRKCMRVCPILSPEEVTIQKSPSAYACWIKDKDILQKSASGGVFYALAEKVIKEGGWVSGAVFDGYKVKHIITNKINELSDIQGTKYFQSDTLGIYKEIKLLLATGAKVLFSGTSCQVAALYKVVGKNFENLITVDLICFGVPSNLTIGVEEKIRGKKLKRIITNRDKIHKGGWNNAYHMTCEWSDGSVTVSSAAQSFMLRSFCSGKVMRKSCYHCPYKTISRQSDITIGDYHCVEGFVAQKEYGISLVLVHSDKGRSILSSNDNLSIYERELLESLQHKRTIYHNDLIYEKCVARRFMVNFLEKAPLWLIDLLYQNIVKSYNPLKWPFTVADVYLFIVNSINAKNSLKKILK